MRSIADACIAVSQRGVKFFDQTDGESVKSDLGQTLGERATAFRRHRLFLEIARASIAMRAKERLAQRVRSSSMHRRRYVQRARMWLHIFFGYMVRAYARARIHLRCVCLEG